MAKTREELMHESMVRNAKIRAKARKAGREALEKLEEALVKAAEKQKGGDEE